MMPAGGGAVATQISGGPEVIDVRVCMSILKKTIVLLPLLIMIVIFLVKAYLTTDTKTSEAVKNRSINFECQISLESSFPDVGV
jgi:hypothetical protein